MKSIGYYKDIGPRIKVFNTRNDILCGFQVLVENNAKELVWININKENLVLYDDVMYPTFEPSDTDNNGPKWIRITLKNNKTVNRVTKEDRQDMEELLGREPIRRKVKLFGYVYKEKKAIKETIDELADELNIEAHKLEYAYRASKKSIAHNGSFIKLFREARK